MTVRARFAADVHMEGMLHAKILRSPYAHARIRSIDASRALAMPGVKAVVTAEDFPILDEPGIDFDDPGASVKVMAANDLAHGKALYKGHAVAALAATLLT